MFIVDIFIGPPSPMPVTGCLGLNPPASDLGTATSECPSLSLRAIISPLSFILSYPGNGTKTGSNPAESLIE